MFFRQHSKDDEPTLKIPEGVLPFKKFNRDHAKDRGELVLETVGKCNVLGELHEYNGVEVANLPTATFVAGLTQRARHVIVEANPGNSSSRRWEYVSYMDIVVANAGENEVVGLEDGDNLILELNRD